METETMETETEETATPTRKRGKRARASETETSTRTARTSSTEDDDLDIAPAPKSATVKRESEVDQADLITWIRTLGVGNEFRVKVERRKPKTHRFKNGDIVDIDGHVGTHEELISEEEIAAWYGGGTYTVSVLIPNPERVGGYQYLKARTVKIPGLPRLPQDDEPMQREDNLGNQAFELLRERISEDGKRGDGESSMLPMLELLMSRMDSVQKAAAEKESKVLEMLMQPKQDSTLELLKTTMSSESSRLESLRLQFDSERRQLQENHREDLKRIEKSHELEIQRLNAAQQQLVQDLKASHAQTIENLKLSFETRVDGLKNRIADLERQLTKTETETVELRARKDKSPIEHLTELAKMREQMDAVMGKSGDDDDEPKGFFDKIATIALENPELVNRFLPGAPQPAQIAPPAAAPPPPQLPPPGVPFKTQQTGDRVFIRDSAASEPRELSIEEIQAFEKQAAKEARRPSKEDIARALPFIENAAKNDVDPAQFAATARAAIPNGILVFLHEEGADAFLATLPTNLDQVTRNFVRKVAKHLVEE